jgi:hypothetical protein
MLIKEMYMTVPWLRQSQAARFNPTTVHVEVVVDRVTLEQVIL